MSIDSPEVESVTIFFYLEHRRRKLSVFLTSPEDNRKVASAIPRTTSNNIYV